MPGLRLYYTNFLYLIDFSQKQSYNRIMNHIYYFYGEESRSHDFLFYVLNRYYGIAASEKDLKKSPCGKLYLEGSAIHLNLSHSKDVVALAVGNSPVGNNDFIDSLRVFHQFDIQIFLSFIGDFLCRITQK